MVENKYNLYLCKDCEIEFMTRKGKHCPNCGENMYVDYQREIWMKRPLLYLRGWTDDDDSLLIECIERGMTNKETGKELGKTRGSVSQRLLYLRKNKEIVRG